jgi:flagellar hook assembly protein FlgD
LWIAQVRNNPLIGGSVTVEFQLARPARVIGTIYDAQGRSARKLVEHWFDAGVHEVSWDGADARGTRLASGVYFVELNAPELDSSSGRKMCVLK